MTSIKAVQKSSKYGWFCLWKDLQDRFGVYPKKLVIIERHTKFKDKIIDFFCFLFLPSWFNLDPEGVVNNGRLFGGGEGDAHIHLHGLEDFLVN